MNTIDVLRQAKALLSDPSRWTQCGAFQTYEGEAYCAVGAIAHARQGTNLYVAAHDPAVAVLASVVKDMRGYLLCDDWKGVAAWNDLDADHAELIDAFDRAILSLAPDTEPVSGPERVEVA